MRQAGFKVMSPFITLQHAFHRHQMYCYIFAFWVCPWNHYWCLCAVSAYMFHFGQNGTPYVWLRPYNRCKVLHFVSNFVCKLTRLLQYLSGETALFSFMLTFLQLQLPKLIIYNPSDSSDTVISHVVVVFLLFFFFFLFFFLSHSLSPILIQILKQK